jgi:hypothetical protein
VPLALCPVVFGGGAITRESDASVVEVAELPCIAHVVCVYISAVEVEVGVELVVVVAPCVQHVARDVEYAAASNLIAVVYSSVVYHLV